MNMIFLYLTINLVYLLVLLMNAELSGLIQYVIFFSFSIQMPVADSINFTTIVYHYYLYMKS